MKRLRRGTPRDERKLFAPEPVAEKVRELAAPCDLMVLTSDEELVRWSRRRVVEVLVLEAAVDARRAEQVAARVEKQLLASGLSAVSTSLVRELVGAELVVAGLAEHHVRHARLGVSLYDAGRILRGEHEARRAGGDEVALDPEATSQFLARRIKRDYALAGVFSSATAEAHRTGGIHIHDLETVDRPETLWLRLGAPASTPPPDGRDLASVAARQVASLQRHVGGYVGIEDPFLALAPFLDGERAARDIGQQLLRDLAATPRAPGGAVVSVRWDNVAHDRGSRAGDVDLARRAALAYVEATAESSAPTPALELVIGPAFFATTGHLRFLEAGLAAAQNGIEVRLRFERVSTRPVRRAKVGSQVTKPVRVPPHRLGRAAVLGSVSLNLPRLGYRDDGTDPEMVEARLLSALGVAARAHIEKRVFLEGLLAQGRSGPLAALVRVGDGAPILSLDGSVHRILPSGLNELAEVVVGSALHQSEEAFAFALRLVERMRRMVETLARRHRLPMALALEPRLEAAARFAKLDLRYHSPIAGHHVRGELRTGVVSYTPGASIEAAATVAPKTRIQLEGRLHEVAPADAATRLPLAALSPRVEGTAQLVMEVYAKTTCRELRLVP